MVQTKYEGEMSRFYNILGWLVFGYILYIAIFKLHKIWDVVSLILFLVLVEYAPRYIKKTWAKRKTNVHVINCDTAPFQPNGWSVEKHTKGGQLEWNPARVKLYLAKCQKSGKRIEGNKIRKQLPGHKVLNANVLDYLLAHPELIPDEWNGLAICFWGTIYRHTSGELCVRCLLWGESQWGWDYLPLDFNFSNSDVAAVAA